MGWCPECKSEYVEGIMLCADCGCPLVAELPADNGEAPEMEGCAADNLLTGWEAAAGEAVVPLTDGAADGLDMTDGAADGLDMTGEADRTEDGAALKEKLEAMAAQQMADQMRSPTTGVYRNNGERAEEHRSSAYTLLAVGGLGLIVIVLFFFDLLPIHVTAFSKYMISGVMGVLFILFLVMGVISMKNSRLLAKKAGKENNLTKEITAWCFDNIKVNELDRTIFTTAEDEGLSEEIKYFKRFDRIKEILAQQFVNLEEGYLERLIDEIYSELFENRETEG